jgi:hypothetical protein
MDHSGRWSFSFCDVDCDVTPVKRPESLDASLIDTVSNSDLVDVGKDVTEMLIDSLLEDGLLKEIPIVRSVVGLAQAGINIRDRLFLEKVLRVLSPLRKYSSETRREYLKSLDEDELKKASQYLILYIDRLDSIEKASMLAKVFEAYLLGKIEYRTMLYFVHFVDSVFILVWQDYHSIIKAYHDKRTISARIPHDDALALEKVGFYIEEYKSIKGLNLDTRETFVREMERKLVLTDAGWRFIQIVFELWPEEGPRDRDLHRPWLAVNLKVK